MVLWVRSAMSTYTRAPLLLRRTGHVPGTLEVQRLVHIDVLQLSVTRIIIRSCS
jgi:hypothetical protein